LTAPGLGPPPAALPRPRLLVVGPLPPPIGGVETVTQAILESHAFDDFELAHCDITKGRPKSTQGRVDAGNLGWALRHFARMRRAVRDFKPDIVYLPVSGSTTGVLRDLALGWIAGRSGARLLGHQHAGDIHHVLARGGLHRRVVFAGFDQFDRLLLLGERWRPMFVDYGVRMPLDVVPSTFRREVVERGAAFERPRHDASSVRALFVGQFGRGKGTLDLLRALQHCRAAGVEVRLTIVGPPQQPNDEAEALRLRSELGLDELVEFTGALLGEPLYEHFRRADLFVLPSYNEGLPVVLYEAGAFALPVITTPVGAISALIRNRENGVLIEPGDVPALIRAITDLAMHPDERRRLGAQLRADVAAFHPDRICERIATHVRETLAMPRRPR
jgi:glycosyltransferase involved in cell wall biosynthesis